MKIAIVWLIIVSSVSLEAQEYYKFIFNSEGHFISERFPKEHYLHLKKYEYRMKRNSKPVNDSVLVFESILDTIQHRIIENSYDNGKYYMRIQTDTFQFDSRYRLVFHKNVDYSIHWRKYMYTNYSFEHTEYTYNSNDSLRTRKHKHFAIFTYTFRSWDKPRKKKLSSSRHADSTLWKYEYDTIQKVKLVYKLELHDKYQINRTIEKFQFSNNGSRASYSLYNGNNTAGMPVHLNYRSYRADGKLACVVDSMYRNYFRYVYNYQNDSLQSITETNVVKIKLSCIDPIVEVDTIVSLYDANRNIILLHRNCPLPHCKIEFKNQYEKGKLIRTVEYVSGKMISETRFSYSPEGWLLSKIEKHKGNSVSSCHYTYYPNGLLFFESTKTKYIKSIYKYYFL